MYYVTYIFLYANMPYEDPSEEREIFYGIFFHPFLQAYYYVVLLDTERKFIYPVQFL